MLEYWGLNASDLIEQVEIDLSGLGFKLTGRGQSGSATRLDFGRPDTPPVSVNVGPLGTLVPQSPEAQGIVYIRW